MVKHALIAFVALLFIAVFTAAAQAQPWPAKPIRMVIPYPAGGSVDVSGRRLAEDLGAELGQPFVVENRAGANGIIATDYVAKSAPDGYTMLVSTLAAHAGNPAAVKSLPYDPVKDFAPVTVINTVPLLLVVHPSVPAKSIADIVRMAKKSWYSAGGAGLTNFPHTSIGARKPNAARASRRGAELMSVILPRSMRTTYRRSPKVSERAVLNQPPITSISGSALTRAR